jgi:hypothetical protein
MAELDPSRVPRIQRFVAVLWPAFLTAGVATILFFTAFDPLEMPIRGDGISRLGAYTLGFFAFWALTSLTALLTCYFLRSTTPRKPGKPDSAIN